MKISIKAVCVLVVFFHCLPGLSISRVAVKVFYPNSFTEVAPFTKDEARDLVLDELKKHGNIFLVNDKEKATDFVYVSFDFGQDKKHFVVSAFLLVRATAKSILGECGVPPNQERYGSIDARLGKLEIGHLQFAPIASAGSFDDYEKTIRGIGVVLCYYFEP